MDSECEQALDACVAHTRRGRNLLSGHCDLAIDQRADQSKEHSCRTLLANYRVL